MHIAQQFSPGQEFKGRRAKTYVRPKISGEALGVIILLIRHRARPTIGAQLVLKERLCIEHGEVLYFTQSWVTKHLLYTPSILLGTKEQGNILFLSYKESVSQRRRKLRQES